MLKYVISSLTALFVPRDRTIEAQADFRFLILDLRLKERNFPTGGTGIPAYHNTGKMPVPPEYNFLDKNKASRPAPVE